MKIAVPLVFLMATSLTGLAQSHNTDSVAQNGFTLGRHTFFDFGPPTDFYELFLVRPTATGTGIERITLTPAGDACTQPAHIEVASAEMKESIPSLLNNADPCAIPEKELSRELHRCKHCAVYSGADVAMQLECRTHTRIIRSEILDKDMFDPRTRTPEHTSWTMGLLTKLDQTLGPDVMNRPVFQIQEGKDEREPSLHANTREDLRAGKFDVLFEKAPDKLSQLYVEAQKHPPEPTVQLLSISPIQPVNLSLPGYPPIARLAHIGGDVVFEIDVLPDGSVTNFTSRSGSPYLRVSVEDAVKRWEFPTTAAGQKIAATIKFATNCPAKEK